MLNENVDFKTQEEWSSIKKIATLFLISYLFIYMFPFPLDNVPGINAVIVYYVQAMDWMTVWFGKNVLGMATLHKIENTGSGDTTLDYVKLIFYPILAIVIAVLVYILTKKNKNYQKLYATIIIYARYYVGIYMIIYGLIKVFNGQFSSPEFHTLEVTYGDSSPMGLLWRFMGYSKSYSIFAAIGEIIGGLLLLFRRTKVLGCLITIGVMLNVAMLNFSYDVPVKLFSSHLVLITIIILAPDIKKLFNFFFLQKEAILESENLFLPKKWMRIGRIVLKSVLMICIPALVIYSASQAFSGKTSTSNSSFKALYIVEDFTSNQHLLPPITTDTVRWSKMLVEDNYVRISTMTDSVQYFESHFDTVNKKLVLNLFSDSLNKYSFNYEEKPDNHFLLTGVYKSDSLSIYFKKKTISDYTLVNRGFHWINERAFNR